jgi:hypothetical protein
MTNLIKLEDGIEVEMTDEEQSDFLASQVSIGSSSTIQKNKDQAKILLDKSDTTMNRIQEAVALNRTTWGASDVIAWIDFREALRQVVSSGTSLPDQPPYPQGT